MTPLPRKANEAPVSPKSCFLLKLKPDSILKLLSFFPLYPEMATGVQPRLMPSTRFYYNILKLLTLLSQYPRTGQKERRKRLAISLTCFASKNILSHPNDGGAGNGAGNAAVLPHDGMPKDSMPTAPLPDVAETDAARFPPVPKAPPVPKVPAGPEGCAGCFCHPRRDWPRRRCAEQAWQRRYRVCSISLICL